MGHIDPAKIGSIIPLILPLGIKFNISSAMIQLLYINSVFMGFPTDDANMNLTNFTRISTSYTYLRVIRRHLD